MMSYSDTEDEYDKDIEQRYFVHIEELNKINTTEFCVIRRAMEKYEEQTKDFCKYEGYIYNKAFWQRIFRYCSVALEINKMNSRIVCSEEKLDAIDFNIIYDYVQKIPFTVRERYRKKYINNLISK